MELALQQLQNDKIVRENTYKIKKGFSLQPPLTQAKTGEQRCQLLKKTTFWRKISSKKKPLGRKTTKSKIGKRDEKSLEGAKTEQSK